MLAFEEVWAGEREGGKKRKNGGDHGLGLAVEKVWKKKKENRGEGGNGLSWAGCWKKRGMKGKGGKKEEEKGGEKEEEGLSFGLVWVLSCIFRFWSVSLPRILDFLSFLVVFLGFK